MDHFWLPRILHDRPGLASSLFSLFAVPQENEIVAVTFITLGSVLMLLVAIILLITFFSLRKKYKKWRGRPNTPNGP